MNSIDLVVLADSRDMTKYIDDETVSLVVTSPPYDVGKKYEDKVLVSDDHVMRLESYLEYLDRVWKECWRVLKIGGRLVINIADTWRQPYLPLHSYVSIRLINAGWFMRGMITWDKMNSAKRCTAWGSWKSPSNPYLRDISESIIVFSKTNESLTGNTKPDITRDEFLEYGVSIWRMETESAKCVGHPAPFPLELPKRAIKFYTYPGDIVLDPFNGSGTTCEAAVMLGRHYIGFDIYQEYVDLANDRLAKYKRKKML